MTAPPSLADANRQPIPQSFAENVVEFFSEVAYRAQGIPGEGIAIAAIGSIGKFSIAASKGVNFSAVAAKHMENPGRYVPVQILQQAIKSSPGLADPRGSRALMHTVEMWRNGKSYQLEVLYDKLTNAVWHFQYNPVR